MADVRKRTAQTAVSSRTTNPAAGEVRPSQSRMNPKQRKNKAKFTKKERVKFIASICMLSLSFIAIATTLLLTWSPFSGGVDLDNSDNEGAITGRNKRDDNVTYFLCAGFDQTESLTDVLMVVAFFKEEKKIKILSIPRDTYIGPEIITGKINAVYGHATSPYPDKKDIRNLVSYINTNVGLPIDYYITIDLKGLRNVVDAIGGVPIYIENNMYDSAGDWLVFKKGAHVLDGQEAEYFVRFRHGYNSGDLGRVDAQKVFLAAFMKKLQGMGKSKMLTLVTGEMMDYIKTDLTVSEMMYYAGAIVDVDLANVETYVVPGKTFTSKYKGSYNLSCYAINKDALVQMLNASFISAGSEIDASIVSPFVVDNLKFSTSSEVETAPTFDDYLTE